jgi:MoaA/NifB/PqqE/SkfB family radical SAM enzyme
MYIQLTDRCNMKCDHCCMDSHSRRKRFMSEHVYELCLRLAEDRSEYTTLGGGEPTLHPMFFPFLYKAMNSYWLGRLDTPPFIVTNGKNRNRAMKLFQLTQEDPDTGMFVDQLSKERWSDPEYWNYYEKAGVAVDLSTDYYHEPIHPDVSNAYHMAENRRKRSYGYLVDRSVEAAGIRNGANTHVMGIGRALKNGIAAFDKDECCCDTLFIDPDGVVFSCGCKHTELGSITDFNIDEILQRYSEEYAHQGGRDIHN